MDPYRAAELGMVDDVIDPGETRQLLIRSMELLRSKRRAAPRRKHGNMPV
jgi:acetyl-CoA carboxylase carboxyltransferase component